MGQAEADLRRGFLLSAGSNESGESCGSGGFAGSGETSGKVSGEKSVEASGEEGEAAA